MKSFEEVKNIYEEEKKEFDEGKERPEKFLISLELANDENKALLKEYGINLKPSDWIDLTIEPEILKKHIVDKKLFSPPLIGSCNTNSCHSRKRFNQSINFFRHIL